MALTKMNTSGGPTGIPNPDPVTVARGGPEGVGGSANTVNPARTRATESAGMDTPGSGVDKDLNDPWGGRAHPGGAASNPANPSGGAGSNVNLPYPTKPTV